MSRRSTISIAVLHWLSHTLYTPTRTNRSPFHFERASTATHVWTDHYTHTMRLGARSTDQASPGVRQSSCTKHNKQNACPQPYGAWHTLSLTPTDVVARLVWQGPHAQAEAAKAARWPGRQGSKTGGKAQALRQADNARGCQRSGNPDRRKNLNDKSRSRTAAPITE